MREHLKSRHQQAVEAFMRKDAEDPRSMNGVPDTVIIPSAGVRRLRAALILEEAFETVEGLGFRVYKRSHREDRVMFEDLTMHEDDEALSLTSIVDGCADLHVVTSGTLSACGVPDEPFLRAVEENNLAKFGPGASRREDGKLIKPPDHKPPDIAGLLVQVKQGDLDVPIDHVAYYKWLAAWRQQLRPHARPCFLNQTDPPTVFLVELFNLRQEGPSKGMWQCGEFEDGVYVGREFSASVRDLYPSINAVKRQLVLSGRSEEIGTR